jgi:hypothetical protein
VFLNQSFLFCRGFSVLPKLRVLIPGFFATKTSDNQIYTKFLTKFGLSGNRKNFKSFERKWITVYLFHTFSAPTTVSHRPELVTRVDKLLPSSLIKKPSSKLITLKLPKLTATSTTRMKTGSRGKTQCFTNVDYHVKWYCEHYFIFKFIFIRRKRCVLALSTLSLFTSLMCKPSERVTTTYHTYIRTFMYRQEWASVFFLPEEAKQQPTWWHTYKYSHTQHIKKRRT